MSDDNGVVEDSLFDGEPVSVSGETLSERVAAAMGRAREEAANTESGLVIAAWQRLQERCDGLPGSRLVVRDITDSHNLADWVDEVQGDLLSEYVVRRFEAGRDPEIYIWQERLARIGDVKNDDGEVRVELLEADEEVVKYWLARAAVWSSESKTDRLYQGAEGEGDRHGGMLTEEDRAGLIKALDDCVGVRNGQVEYWKPNGGGKGRGKQAYPEAWVLRYPVEHYPPYKVARQVLAKPSAEFPAVGAVLRRPMLTRSGRGLIYAPGYYRDEMVYMASAGLGEVWEVRDSEEVRAAMGVVWKPFREFPWDGPASRANFVAALFTAIAGRAVRGPLPGWLFGKAQPRTGASLLSRVVSLLVTGDEPADVSPDVLGSKNEELIKSLVTAGMSSSGVVRIDNLTGTLSSAEMMAYLTAPKYKRRLLGGNREITIDRRNQLDIITANNLKLTAESAGRTVSVRLDALMASPESRSGWAIKRLDEYVLGHRGELLGALCGVVQAWWRDGGQEREVEGEPSVLGGFESWRGLCWSFLTWLDEQLAGAGEWEFERDGEVRGVLREFLGNQLDLESFLTGDEDDESEMMAWLWMHFQIDEFQSADVTQGIKELGEPENQDWDFEWARVARADGKKGGVSYAVRGMMGRLAGKTDWVGERQVQLKVLPRRGKRGRARYQMLEVKRGG